MATEGAIHEESYEAAANLSSYQFHFVKFSGDRTVALVTAKEDCPFGILQNAPNAQGKAAIVMISGESKFVSSGTTAAGDLISPSDDAHGLALSIPTAGQYICGQVSAGADDGEIGTVNIDCSAPRRAA